MQIACGRSEEVGQYDAAKEGVIVHRAISNDKHLVIANSSAGEPRQIFSEIHGCSIIPMKH